MVIESEVNISGTGVTPGDRTFGMVGRIQEDDVQGTVTLTHGMAGRRRRITVSREQYDELHEELMQEGDKTYGRSSGVNKRLTYLSRRHGIPIERRVE
jgi:hypothetical protein